jgi:hypothetical protein
MPRMADTRFKRGNPIGKATRFQPGNRCSVGYGRPRTAKFAGWIKRLGIQWSTEPGSGWTTQWEQFTRTCLREALNGSAPHAQLLARFAHPDLWRETQQVLEAVIENPAREWLLRRRPPSRRVPLPRKTGGKQVESSLNSGFADKQEALPAIEQRPASAKRGIRIELW